MAPPDWKKTLDGVPWWVVDLLQQQIRDMTAVVVEECLSESQAECLGKWLAHTVKQAAVSNRGSGKPLWKNELFLCGETPKLKRLSKI